MVTFDAAAPGTSAAVWAADARTHDRPPLDLDGATALVVIAAHPDDETLGAGGLIATCAERGLPVTVVVVTDGAGSHPDDARIGRRRAGELLVALDLLGVTTAPVLLGFPDGGTREHREGIAAALAAVLEAVVREEPDGTTAGAPGRILVAAPWTGDGHRDHRVVGEIVRELVARDAAWLTLLAYPIWMRHWADPDHAAVPWESMRALAIDARRKSAAIDAHSSQHAGEEPMLHARFLENFRGGIELFVVEEAAPAAAPPAAPLGADYFDALYARRDDPWRLASRWYERRKRDATMAVLPAERYSSALEIGCSIGLLTERLAERCDALLAVDIAEEAVALARRRLAHHASSAAVRIEHRDALRALPDGVFDLIVLSEVGYYADLDALDRLVVAIEAALHPAGALVACHWRHPVADYPLRGDDVHARLARSSLERTVSHVERDFVLEVYARDGRSVAEREGLA
ncbi:bifunctional PIG-L family deacetylase/class I SAM-dependent methyltransferase [Yonghaparkia sp. Root332]|uniref:bifunctional PIG-L family deacetylase/class I SAM-dependent methyltransferase n=1 Tax=Yonghaparkia sp. Root332 TaxID=1736516 RepID=UPI0006F764A8|nr:bifunctional PIG-L family deacetylase/class I SAM-dependent methyltransferase [Yonghaparkia sp. Root332]KQV25997.1 hypothetical protein ASC54_03360 [Yonghaparkia sp. Root332]